MKSLSAPARAGFWLAVLLGVVDVATTVIPVPADGTGPPLAIVIASGVLGVLTLVAAVVLARTGRRAWVHAVNATRIVSALLFLPAFLMPDVPGWVVGWAIVTIVLTAVSVVLLHRATFAPVAARTTETV